MLEGAGVSDGGESGWVLVLGGERLEGANPERFAVQDVDDLIANGWEAEARYFRRVVSSGELGEVIEQEGEALVSPVVEFADSGEGEHGLLEA